MCKKNRHAKKHAEKKKFNQPFCFNSGEGCPCQSPALPLVAFGGITNKNFSFAAIKNHREIINMSDCLPCRNITTAPGSIVIKIPGVYRVSYSISMLNTLLDGFVNAENTGAQATDTAGNTNLFESFLKSGIDFSGILDLTACVRAGVLLNGIVLEQTTANVFNSYTPDVTLTNSTLINLAEGSVLNLALWSFTEICSNNSALIFPGCNLTVELLGQESNNFIL